MMAENVDATGDAARRGELCRTGRRRGRAISLYMTLRRKTGKPLTTHQFYDGTQHPWEFKRVLAPGAFAKRAGHGVRGSGGCGAVPFKGWREVLAGTFWIARSWNRSEVAAWGRRDVFAHGYAGPTNAQRMYVAISAAGAFRTERWRKDVAADKPRIEIRNTFRVLKRRWGTASTALRCTGRSRMCCSCRSIGRDAQRQCGELWHEISGNLPTDFGFVMTLMRMSRIRSMLCRSRATPSISFRMGNCGFTAARTGGNEWEALTKGFRKRIAT